MRKIETNSRAKRAPVAAKSAAARNLAAAERLAACYVRVFQTAAQHGVRIPSVEASLSATTPVNAPSAVEASGADTSFEAPDTEEFSSNKERDDVRARYWLAREQNLRLRWKRVNEWALSGVVWNRRRQGVAAKLADCRTSALCRASIDRRLVDAFVDEVIQSRSLMVSGELNRDEVELRFDVPAATLLVVAEALDEQRALIRYERGIMVQQNRSLVAGIARRFAGQGIQVDDLIQEGTLGLLRAIDKFDPNRGFQFSTYAIWWIRQGISRAVLDQGRSVRIPVHMKEQSTRIRNVEGRLSHRLGRVPSQAEIAADAGISEAKVLNLQQHLRPDVSLQRPLGNDSDGGEFGDTLEDEDALRAFATIEFGRLEEHLSHALAKLDARSQFVVRAHMGLGGQPSLTLDGISQRLGISRERVRQIEREALMRLRRSAEETHLVEYV
jgi:RNA polymerase nonessential primary-like sigma factor